MVLLIVFDLKVRSKICVNYAKNANANVGSPWDNMKWAINSVEAEYFKKKCARIIK